MARQDNELLQVAKRAVSVEQVEKWIEPTIITLMAGVFFWLILTFDEHNGVEKQQNEPTTVEVASPCLSSPKKNPALALDLHI